MLKYIKWPWARLQLSRQRYHFRKLDLRLKWYGNRWEIVRLIYTPLPAEHIELNMEFDVEALNKLFRSCEEKESEPSRGTEETEDKTSAP